MGAGAGISVFDGKRKAQRRAAAAAGRVAMEQQGIAREGFKQVSEIVNPVSVQSLADMEKALKFQERNLSRQEELIKQIDPAILEASQQALKLLKGEESSTLSPLKSQRAKQRQKLLNTLREQLGPGAETSTAGMQALNQFDAETDTLFSGAQQQALGNLGSIAGQFSQMRPDMLRESQGFGQLATGRQGIALNQANAMITARQPLLASAGAQFVGEQIKQQNRASHYGGLIDLGIRGAAAYATGGASEAGRAAGAMGGGGDSSGGSFSSPSAGMGTMGGQNYLDPSNIA